MDTETATPPVPTTVDVTGLSADAIRSVESLVAFYRRNSGEPPPDPRYITDPRPTLEEFRRRLDEMASGPPVPTLPPDWSRADLYDDHD